MAEPPARHVDGAIAFCDLAGFTAFTAERGDDAALDLVETFRAHVVEQLPQSARIVNQVGDGLLLLFADPASAIAALLALTARCADRSTADAPLWLRTGVHVGRARALGEDLIGHDVNVTARIGELAAATEVLASETARAAATGEGISFDALGPVFVKGVPEPLRLYRASRASASLASSGGA